MFDKDQFRHRIGIRLHDARNDQKQEPQYEHDVLSDFRNYDPQEKFYVAISQEQPCIRRLNLSRQIQIASDKANPQDPCKRRAENFPGVVKHGVLFHKELRDRKNHHDREEQYQGHGAVKPATAHRVPGKFLDFPIVHGTTAVHFRQQLIFFVFHIKILLIKPLRQNIIN